MRTVAEETREGKIGYNGQEIFDGVPLGGTAMAASVAPSLYPAEEWPTNNCPAQNIGCGIKTIETASRLDYQTRDCIGESWK